MTIRAPVSYHLAELKRRVIYILVFYSLASLSALLIVPDVLTWLVHPLEMAATGPLQLAYFHLADGFLLTLNIACKVGAVFTLPVFLWHLWRFVSPGLHPSEYSLFGYYLGTSLMLALSGVVLAYFWVLPAAWAFFLDFQLNIGHISVQYIGDILSYCEITLMLMLVFAISFQWPVLLYWAGTRGWISSTQLRKSRRLFIVLTLLVAAFLTPPDILSQVALAAPILLLNELTILALARHERKKVH